MKLFFLILSLVALNIQAKDKPDPKPEPKEEPQKTTDQRGGGAGDGNGGAGVFRNGSWVTYFEAGYYKEPNVAKIDSNYVFPITKSADIPGLDKLIAFINQANFLAPTIKQQIVNSLVPSPQHIYYKAQEDQFDRRIQDALRKKFNKATGVPVNQLQLWAVTDVNNGMTFLLPEFYKLTETEQVVLLFHENYWLMHKQRLQEDYQSKFRYRVSDEELADVVDKALYENIVNTEMSFEAVFREPQNTLRVLKLLEYIGDNFYRLAFTIKADIESGALNGLLKDGKIALSNFIGTAQQPNSPQKAIKYLRLLHPNSLILAKMDERPKDSYEKDQISDFANLFKAVSDFRGNGKRIFSAHQNRNDFYNFEIYASDENHWGSHDRVASFDTRSCDLVLKPALLQVPKEIWYGDILGMVGFPLSCNTKVVFFCDFF